MGEHISGEGWNNWKNLANESTARYSEFKSYGAGAKPNERVKWIKQLTDEEMKKFTVATIFNNWNPNE
jgi:pectinesterase